jgi:hypothetical protein
MTMLDQILIDRFFSPVTGWLRHRLGVCQWRVSLECLNGNVAFYLAGIALSIAGKGMADGIFIDLLKGAAWLLIVDFARRVALRQSSSSIGVQSARMGEWLIRLVLVLMLPLSMINVRGLTSLCFTLSLLFLVLHLYFKASDTPPPEPRRKLGLARLRG